MIKIENTQFYSLEAAIRGMRNPMNSWEKSDSDYCDCCCWVLNDTDQAEQCRFGRIEVVGEDECVFCDCDFLIGPNDHALMMKLAKAGPVHAKYRRMITVSCDITAPLYWWKEFDTYKIGTVANSCSTMHKIAEKEFTVDDFSHEHLFEWEEALSNDGMDCAFTLSTISDEKYIAVSECILSDTITALNYYREKYNETHDKRYWWQMIQLLPTSYNQRRTVQMNFEVLAHIYPDRINHKLDEWHEFCQWIEALPYSEFVTLKTAEGQKED